MRPLLQEIQTARTPESLAERARGEPGLVLLRSALFEASQARYSFVAAGPFLTFRSFGSRCETAGPDRVQFGDPWKALDGLMGRYELLDEIDLPFPLGGCFGYWGYDMKNFVEPRLPRRAANDLELPDCHAGFYDALVVFDHRLGKTWVVSTGMGADGSCDKSRAEARLEFWRRRLADGAEPARRGEERPEGGIVSNLSRSEFVARARRVQDYIRAGDVYQVNLSHRLTAESRLGGWEFYLRLCDVSPAPFSAYLDCGDFQLCSSSPELFLRLSGARARTRPIKGTRPRSANWGRDAQLGLELRTSAKEMSELVMITDLLRNDLGKICEFGSVRAEELARLERYPQVQHLVSTVAGRLRADQTHFSAFASCFPGGSVTGAPKIRAMEIIDELEPCARGPYTGAVGYLGFNRESQLSVTIRAAICRGGRIHFQVGAGIVSDSAPEAEYEETLAKAGGFFAALARREKIGLEQSV
jgi:para-aminobenzoate synthetase component 1